MLLMILPTMKSVFSVRGSSNNTMFELKSKRERYIFQKTKLKEGKQHHPFADYLLYGNYHSAFISFWDLL